MSWKSRSKPTKPLPLPSEAKRKWKRWTLGCYRLGIIVAALACLRALPTKGRELDPAFALSEARSVISQAAQLGEPSEGMYPLLNSGGEVAGWVTSSYPQAEKIQGYSGPSELLVILDVNRTVKAVRFLHSADTDGHVKKVREDSPFWEQWNGKTEAMLGAPGKTRVVTGATLTSEAMARGIAARFGAEGMDEWFPSPLKVEQITKWFPAADRLEDLKEAGSYRVFKGSEALGTVLRSSRMGVSARGFNGISDVIVSLAPDGETILGVGMLGSRDNVPYIDDVMEEMKYTDGFAGRKAAEITAGTPEEATDFLVSGASVTTSAVIESVHEMLRRHQAAEAAAKTIPWKNILAFIWIGLGVVVGLSKWGNKFKYRVGFAMVSVAAGIGLGWMVSQDQLLGWGSNGFGLRGALPLLVLTAVAMVVPAFTGKNIYCSRICPHGAAQSLAGQAVKKRFVLPKKAHALMERVPWLTLMAIWVLAFLGSNLPFAYFEPFETWSSGFVAWVPATILTVGLLAAVFLPQAYCHYGCPTGAMFKFLTHAPGRWTSKDSIATALIAAAGLFVFFK